MGREGDFTPKVKLQAWKASRGHCKMCGSYIAGKVPHYDHIKPLSMGGTGDLANCQVLCTPCHCIKTGQEAPIRAKAVRAGRNNAGIPQKKKSMPGSRNSPWKRKMDGTVVKR